MVNSPLLSPSPSTWWAAAASPACPPRNEKKSPSQTPVLRLGWPIWKWMKSKRSWLMCSFMGRIFSLQFFTSRDMTAGKLGDTMYVMLLTISWSQVATTGKRGGERGWTKVLVGSGIYYNFVITERGTAEGPNGANGTGILLIVKVCWV